MKFYGTKNNKDFGFYEENFQNAIEIDDRYWEYLLSEQADGKIIILYENQVIAVDENEYELENNVWRKLSEEEIQEKITKKQNQNRIHQIELELESLDKKRIRAIAEPSMKDEETSWLEFYNHQIQKLRDELQQIYT